MRRAYRSQPIHRVHRSQSIHRSRRRPEDNAPVNSRQRESTVLIGIAFLITVVFVSLAQTADHPVAAAGIGLQTLAGLFAAVQLWANNASNTLLRWAASQIVSNRWHVAGLFNGRLRSLSIAVGWFFTAYIANRLFLIWRPGEIVGWPIAIVLAANFVVAALVFVPALFMYMAAGVLDGEPLPEGEASTGLQARLAGNDWVWPLVALTFLLGGMLQIASA
jgi:hypothetical protein